MPAAICRDPHTPDRRRTRCSGRQPRRQIGLVNPFAETTTFVYDIAGYEQRRVLACGVTVSHLYDAAGCETVLRIKTDATPVINVLAKCGWRPYLPLQCGVRLTTR